MKGNELPEGDGNKPAVPKKESLAERMEREFKEGFTEARSGIGGDIPGFRVVSTRWDWNSEEAMRKAARDNRDMVAGASSDQYDGYLYDMHGNRIGVYDPTDVMRKIVERESPRPKVTVTGYTKIEPLALPQYSESTLREMEERDRSMQ